MVLVGETGGQLKERIEEHLRDIRLSPNHRGRHLGKMNGHNSTYVKAWQCTFGQITRVVMGKSWGKLL